MQRREDEEQCERVCCQNEQRDDARARGERRSRRRAVHPSRPDGAGRAAGARRPSRRARRAPSANSASTGQLPATSVAGFGGRLAPSGHAPSPPNTANASADEEPEGEACPQAPRGRQQRDPPPPAVGEEIDGTDEARHEQRDEQQLDRPAADDRDRPPRRSSSFPAPARRPGRATRSAPARRAPSPRAGLRAALSARSVNAVGRPLAGRRQRHRRNAARNERPLFVERDRKAEVDQLGDEAGVSRPLPALLEHPLRGRLDERRCGRPGRVAGDHNARRACAGNRRRG